MAQRFRGGGGVAGALGGLPPGAGRNPPVDPAAAFAAYNQRGGLPARGLDVGPEYDPGPIVNRAADVLVSVRRAELELAVQRRTLVELREEIAALREARDRDARNEAPAAAAVYKVAARLSTDERRLEEFANVFKAMADRIKVLERQSEGYLEVGQRRLNALEARLGGVGDVGQLAVAAKRTAEEAANNSVAIELQENHLDGVKADVARVGQGVESSKKLAERVRDEGAKVADNLRTSLSGAEAQARAALTDESSARRDAVARAEENAVANVRELERREHERFLDVQTTIDGVDARVVQEVSDREKAVGEVATDVVRRWDAIHEVRVQDQQARQAEGEALRTAIALAHRQTNRAVDDLGDEVRAAKRAFEDRAKTVEKAERERIDAYQKVATKRFDELERVLSAEIAARRDGASKLAARQVAVEDAARDDLLKSCSKLGARIEDVDHRVGDGLRAMQESALTTAKAVAQCRVELSAADAARRPRRSADRKTADADGAEAARVLVAATAKRLEAHTESRHSDAKTLARALVEDEAAARVRVAADLRLEAEERRRSREREAAARDAAAYLLHRVADEAQGAKNAALAREIDATEDRSRRRFEANGRRLRPRRGRAAADDALDRRDHARAALGAALDRVADGDAAARRAQLGRDARATDAEATASAAWRENETDARGRAEAAIHRRIGGEEETRIHGDAALGERIDDEEEERIGADAAARAASEEAFADARARAESAAALDRRGPRRRRGPAATLRTVCDAIATDIAAENDRARAAEAALASEAREAAELQRRRTDDQAALAEAVSTLEDELEDADLRLAATAAAADAATRDALFATDARLGDSLDERASALAGRVDDEVRDRVAALAAHAEKTDETTSALGVDVAEARTAAAALTSDVEVKLLARTSELEAKLEEDLASRGSSLEARAAELEEKLAEEATSRGADFQRVTEDLEAKAAALTDAVAAEAAARDSALVAAKDAEQQRFYETTQENEEKRDALKAELTEALAAESAARTEALASETAARAEALASETAARAELSKEVGLLDATLEERCSGLDHKIDEEIRAAGASSTDALQVLKDEIATTEEVKRAELSAKLSEDLDGNYSALESKVEDADAKAKALETKLADVEHKLADEASSRAAAVDGCKAAAEAKVAALKSELTDDVSKRVGDVKASLEAEIRDAREKADKAEKSADKAGKEAAKASTFEEPPSDDDGPEKETPPQEEPKKDD
ncbi:hypothetical protein SO694_00026252 [Aureococcus anophagefferens]|uniref:Uncharacterized protein n=1 Tax=Aureococcus anophagefferens TaxID=44056 RepID=A0ABR1FUI1_AURAN